MTQNGTLKAGPENRTVTDNQNRLNVTHEQRSKPKRDLEYSNRYILIHSAGIMQGIRMAERGELDGFAEDPKESIRRLKAVVSRTEDALAKLLGIGERDYGARMQISHIVQEGIVKGAELVYDYK